MDVLDRVLDKGVVIAGDVCVSLLDIELLTIKIRLLIASVDKAKEMGIDWWAHDPQLSSASKQQQRKLEADRNDAALRDRIDRLESKLDLRCSTARPERLSESPARKIKGDAGGEKSAR